MTQEQSARETLAEALARLNRQQTYPCPACTCHRVLDPEQLCDGCEVRS